MSFRCEVGIGCPSDAKFECTCKNRVHMCSQHVEAHANECGSSPKFIGRDLITQAAEVSEAISHLKELRAKVWENSENLVQIIHRASRILMSRLESMQKILDEIQFGTAWDSRNVESIKVLKIEDISLENFESTIKGIVSFKEALPKKKLNDPPVTAMPEPKQKNPIPPPAVSSSVELLEQKKQQALAIGVSSDYIDKWTEEVKFTGDGKYVFICNLYVDCKFYQGI